MKQLAFMGAAAFVVWLASLLPAWMLGGEVAVLHSAVAFVLCLAPAALTLGWAIHGNQDPHAQAIAVLGGTGIRLFVTLGGGALLHYTWPATFPTVFWAWVALFYFVTLGLEVALVLRKKTNSTAT